jgi:hypothetical protein
MSGLLKANSSVFYDVSRRTMMFGTTAVRS